MKSVVAKHADVLDPPASRSPQNSSLLQMPSSENRCISVGVQVVGHINQNSRRLFDCLSVQPVLVLMLLCLEASQTV